uniref:Rho-GAP domain-containing protein n=1 Tax=Angiostrongylus cantonensis TaxID=6313 RepID=A0A158PAX3_ANGCA
MVGPTPPKPVMSIIAHLQLYGCDTEGIFRYSLLPRKPGLGHKSLPIYLHVATLVDQVPPRKCPKKSEMLACRSEVDLGLVPDWEKYDVHVLASVLKDYLRNIPGGILLVRNYKLWLEEVVDQPNHEKKVDHNVNHLCSLVSTYSDDDGSQQRPTIEEVGEEGANSPTVKSASDVVLPELSLSFLEVINEGDEGEKPTRDLHEFWKEAVGIDTTMCSTCKRTTRSLETQKPIVHMHPYTPDPPSQEPILPTIAERLRSLNDNHLNVECTSLKLRQLFLESGRTEQFRQSDMSLRTSCNLLSIGPLSDDQLKNNPPTEGMTDMTRPFSQRGEKNTVQRDVQRAASMKSGRRCEPRVGMDSLEINWSVRQLKELFQDATKLPSINVDPTINQLTKH